MHPFGLLVTPDKDMHESRRMFFLLPYFLTERSWLACADVFCEPVNRGQA